MWLKHIQFSFEQDARQWRDIRIPGLIDIAGIWKRLFCEVQFAATELTAIGGDRNRLPGADRVNCFAVEIVAKWNRRAIEVFGSEPATIERLAQVLHAEGRDFVKLYPLVAVHAARVSCFEDMTDAVTYVSCAVPLQVIHGQVTYRPSRLSSEDRKAVSNE